MVIGSGGGDMSRTGSTGSCRCSRTSCRRRLIAMVANSIMDILAKVVMVTASGMEAVIPQRQWWW